MTLLMKSSLLALSLILFVSVVHSDKIGNGLAAATPADSSSNRTIEFRQFVDQDKYYYYDFYITSDGKVQIQITNYDLTTEQLKFSSEYPLYYRAQYYNFIIVQEMNGNTSISYWVLQIIESDIGHTLSSFPVNSTYDYYDFNFNDEYILTSIIEYSSNTGLLYITLRTKNYSQPDGTPGNFDVYAIDVKNKGNKLYTSNWFYFTLSKPERIVGGNSRVLVEATNNQFWIFKSNDPQIDDYPSTYTKVDISDLTTLQIYPGGSNVYKLRETYFQYVSLSPDGKQISTFVYHGYGKDQVMGEAHLESSTNPIRIFSDQATFFVAVSEDDVYITIMIWDSLTQQFIASSRSFKQTVGNNSVRARYIAQFNQALIIQQHDGKLFLLTPERFSVYGVQKIYQTTLLFSISVDDDVQYLLLAYMRQYYRNLALQ